MARAISSGSPTRTQWHSRRSDAFLSAVPVKRVSIRWLVGREPRH